MHVFTWTEAFPCRKAAASSVAKVLLEKITSIWGTSLELHSDWRIHFIGQVLSQICAIWPVSSTTFSFCLSSSLFRTGWTYKWNYQDPLAKLVKNLQIPQPKIFLLVLLNLGPVPFRIHKLSPFEIIIGQPMHLVPASFDLQIIKGDIFQFCKGLIKSIDNNNALEE